MARAGSNMGRPVKVKLEVDSMLGGIHPEALLQRYQRKRAANCHGWKLLETRESRGEVSFSRQKAEGRKQKAESPKEWWWWSLRRFADGGPPHFFSELRILKDLQG